MDKRPEGAVAWIATPHGLDGYPQTISAAFDRGPHGVTGSGGARLMCGNGFAAGGFVESHKECRAALDAAQDEIEKLISDLETLRAERDDIQRRFDLTWAYAKPRVTVMTSVPNPASSPGGAS